MLLSLNTISFVGLKVEFKIELCKNNSENLKNTAFLRGDFCRGKKKAHNMWAI
jgi:hypothetical protein